MHLSSHKIWSVVILIILFCMGVIQANIRAPLSINYMPSSALFNKGNPELIVKKEYINFECDSPYTGIPGRGESKTKFCNVMLNYYVVSKESMNIALEFISPSRDNLEIFINEENVHATGEEKLSISNKEEEMMDFNNWHNRPVPPLYRISFEGNVEKGKENVITIKYKQLMGAFETGHGYCSEGRWISKFSYELWPLKEWTLDDTFELTVVISVIHENKGLFSRSFSSKNVSCSCRTIKEQYLYNVFKYKPRSLAQEPNFSEVKPDLYKKDDRLYYRTRFNNTFPDRLECMLEP